MVFSSSVTSQANTEPGAAERLTATVGNVDILVNNAGVIPSGSLFDVDEAAYSGTVEVLGVIFRADDDGYAVLEVQDPESGEGFATWVAKTREHGGVLDGASFTELARPSKAGGELS